MCRHGRSGQPGGAVQAASRTCRSALRRRAACARPTRRRSRCSRICYRNSKHLLVEKPLFADDPADLLQAEALAEKNRTVCYTAYNHRFEPHFVRMKELLESGRLGQIYCIRMFYGNGTARLVRDSAWRDQGAGVLPDLGSHLLDTALFWFGRAGRPGSRIQSANRFENRAFDHVAFGANTARRCSSSR